MTKGSKFDDFLKAEQIEIEEELVKDKVIEELKAENERLKKENEILLCQLVINDGEDVTVQISKSQFDKYNKYRKTLQEIKELAEVGQDKYHNGLIIAKPILDLITKAESEE